MGQPLGLIIEWLPLVADVFIVAALYPRSCNCRARHPIRRDSMSKQPKQSKLAAETVSAATSTTPRKSVLQHIDALLQEGQAEKARSLISHRDLEDPWLRNALGVCLLRLGAAEEALKVLRPLALTSNNVILRTDVPLIFQSNFAAALLATGRVRGCLDTLREIDQDQHPAVQRLRDTVARWKSQLGFWQRLSWMLGGEIERPVAFVHPPGDLSD